MKINDLKARLLFEENIWRRNLNFSYGREIEGALEKSEAVWKVTSLSSSEEPSFSEKAEEKISVTYERRTFYLKLQKREKKAEKGFNRETLKEADSLKRQKKWGEGGHFSLLSYSLKRGELSGETAIETLKQKMVKNEEKIWKAISLRKAYSKKPSKESLKEMKKKKETWRRKKKEKMKIWKTKKGWKEAKSSGVS